jgi:hypothetical protein
VETPTSTPRPHARLRRSILSVAGLVSTLTLAAGTIPTAEADPGDNGRVSRLNEQIKQLDRQYGGDLAKLKDAQFGVQRALSKSKQLRADLQVTRGLVAQMAASQYMTGGTDPAASLLASDDPSNLLNNVTLVSHVAQNQANRVKQLQDLVTEQERARAQAQQKIKDLDQEIQDLQRQKARVKLLLKKFKPQSPSSGMGGVTPRMLQVKTTLDTEFGPFPTIGCVRLSADPQDHATGQACDFMVTTGGRMASGGAQTLGDQTAAYAISHAERLGVKYVIWRQRIYDMRNPGWRGMENRGGATANHYDHVHISVF